MGTTAAEAGGLQLAGGDEVPLQMTANYGFAMICNNLRRLEMVEAVEGSVGCSVVVFLIFRRFVTIEAVEGSGSGGGSLF